MSWINYTLDRFEGDYAIFLKRPDETTQLLIHRADLSIAVKQGDLVKIQDYGKGYHIEVLTEETRNKKKQLTNLMNQLKNKNK